MSEQKGVKLLKVDAKITTTNDQHCFQTKLLIDGGASHSFIHINTLPNEIKEKIKRKDKSLNLTKTIFTLQTATSSSDILCYVGNFKIQIGKWSGMQRFVISDEVKSERALVGRDFLKKYRAIVNHGTDEIKLNQRDNEIFSLTKINCKLSEKVIIPPQSVNIIKTTIPTVHIDKTILFEPNENINTHGLLWATNDFK